MQDSSVGPGRRGVLAAVLFALAGLAGIAWAIWSILGWLELGPLRTMNDDGAPAARPVATGGTPFSRLLKRRPEEGASASALPDDHPYAKTRVTGRVIDAESRAGIGGALLAIHSTTGAPKLGPKEGDGAARFVSEPNGDFALLGIPPGMFEVSVAADGYAPRKTSFKKFDVVEDDHGFEVPLLRSSPVEGRVVDLQGRGVSGARVYAGAPGQPLGQTDSNRATLTDDEGRFVIDPAANEPLRLVAVDTARGSGAVMVPAAAAGESREAILTLDEGVRVEGRVVGASGPIAGAQVNLRLVTFRAAVTGSAWLADESGGVRSDEAGRFSLTLPAVGPVVLVASAAGYASTHQIVQDPATLRGELEILLGGGLSVSGRVVSLGRAVPGAEVTISARHNKGVLPGQAKTDASGHFELQGVPEEGPYRVQVEHPDHPSLLRDEPRLGARLELELEAQGRVLVEVVDDRTGAPINEFEFRARGRDPEAMRAGGGTSPAGWLEIDQLVPDVYEIWIGSEGYGQAHLSGVAVSAGAVTKGLQARLPPAGGIEGRAVGPTPMTGRVYAFGEEGQTGLAELASDGSFRVSGLSPGSYRVVVEIASGRTAFGEVESVVVEAGRVTADVQVAVSWGRRPHAPAPEE